MLSCQHCQLQGEGRSVLPLSCKASLRGAPWHLHSDRRWAILPLSTGMLQIFHIFPNLSIKKKHFQFLGTSHITPTYTHTHACPPHNINISTSILISGHIFTVSTLHPHPLGNWRCSGFGRPCCLQEALSRRLI